MSEDIPWKLRVFLSVDLVGSTAFKNSKPHSISPGWAYAFQQFFEDFPRTLLSNYSVIPNELHQPESKLEVWKFSGDEILFQAEICSHKEALSHVWVFKSAIKSFDERWHGKRLSLKATGWLAGFPVTNREVTLQLRAREDEVVLRDFIGPSIDLGFRLTRFSNKNRFVVSADLAILLLDAIGGTSLLHPCKLFYQGKEILKGVNSGLPYPIVWVHMRDGEPSPEELLLGVRYDVKHDILKTFLYEFLDSSVESPSLRLPFIFGDSDPRYNQVPKEFADEWTKLQESDPEREYGESVEKDEANISEDKPPTQLHEPEAKELMDSNEKEGTDSNEEDETE